MRLDSTGIDMHHQLADIAAWVYRATRIPVAALFINLEDGVCLAELVELFPGTQRSKSAA